MTKFAHFYFQQMDKQAAAGIKGTVLSMLAGALSGGGASYLQSRNFGLSNTEAVLPAILAAGMGARAGQGISGKFTPGSGLQGVASAASKNTGKIVGAIGTDMAVSPAYAVAKRHLRSQDLGNQILEKQIGSPPPKPSSASTTVVNNPPSSSGFPGGIPGMIAAGVLTAAGAGALYQIARANKRRADGLETPAQTNVTVAGGAGGTAAPGEPAAPGTPSTSAGTLRVTLPTRRPGDNESQVEMPLERIGLSNAILTKIRRDVKRRLRSEGNARTHRILPPAPLSAALN